MMMMMRKFESLRSRIPCSSPEAAYIEQASGPLASKPVRRSVAWLPPAACTSITIAKEEDRVKNAKKKTAIKFAFLLRGRGISCGVCFEARE